MNNDTSILRRAVALALAIPASVAMAQEGARQTDAPQEVEEVVVVGRLLSAAESLVTERITVPFSADFLGADVIARAGDPDIASALRRVPGLTVVDGKFVYVRGLGERYSSVTVNGAAVPSPELTRSVIPLDLFPTSIVESIKIQKSPSPDQPAGFGGGAIDIRTTSIPLDVVADASIGLGYNDLSDSNGLVFPGNQGSFPAAIMSAINTYAGDISVTNIFNDLRRRDPLVPISAAQTIHQGLIDALNTDVAPRQDSLDPDTGLKAALGNSWDLNQDWRFGALLNVTYGDQYRNESQYREGVGNPDINFTSFDRTVKDERTVGALNLGLEYLGDHLIEFAAYNIQDDEYDASVEHKFDNNFPPSGGTQILNYFTRLEQRELKLTQFSGRHTFAETPRIGEFLRSISLDDLEFNWFFSDSQVMTEIPNEASFQGQSTFDPATGNELSTNLFNTTGMGKFAFLNLDDDQTSWGGNLILPLDLDHSFVTLSGGWWGYKKSRDYRGYTISLDSGPVPLQYRQGGPADVLTPGNLLVANGFSLSMQTGIGTESYIAAQKLDAAYGKVDVDFNNNWRFTIGARYENYQQTVLPVDLLDFNGSSVLRLQEQLSDPDQRLAIADDDVFGSMALTFNSDGLFGSDQYQLRASFGQTVVRPDLREVADVVYIDPELLVRVSGKSSLQASPIDNFELRGEFYYGNGDNFTVSLFTKSIDAPIEQVKENASDTNVLISFENGLSGEVSGVEFEALKRLPAGFFLAGNLTLSDSEVRLDPNSPNNLTNLTRRMTGHSEWVVNATVGYDANNGRHSAYLNFNSFGDRIYSAGIDSQDDVYEQPFDSLGIVYKYYPTDRIELQLKLDNILDASREFTQRNINTDRVATVLAQDAGKSVSLSGRWTF
jgi:outer membrane receptor protein involved in Fe transport